MNKEKLKDFKFRFRIFMWYMATEPFRSVLTLFKMSKQRLKFITKQSSWLIIYLGFVIFFFFVSNDRMKWAFLILLLIAIYKYEWERGMFMHRYREKYRERLKKTYGQHTPTDEELLKEYEMEKDERSSDSKRSRQPTETVSGTDDPSKKEEVK